MGKGLAMKQRHAGAGLVIGLLLAACGNAPGMEERRGEIAALTRLGKASGAAVAPQLTAAAVAASPVPLIGLQTATRHGVVAKVAESHGTVSYASPDGVTLGLRQGMLVAVRGLQSDLMSASAPSASRITSGQGGYRRSYQILDGLGQLAEQQFDCTLTPRGQEEIRVADRIYPSRVMAETCRNAEGGFENLYWIDGSGSIRETRQWIGSGVDFLRLSFG